MTTPRTTRSPQRTPKASRAEAATPSRGAGPHELIVEVREDDVDGGYVATALGVGIHTEAETIEELRGSLREAIACHYDDPAQRPAIVRLHFVRDEVLTP